MINDPQKTTVKNKSTSKNMKVKAKMDIPPAQKRSLENGNDEGKIITYYFQIHNP